jgi:hypothetical protein
MIGVSSVGNATLIVYDGAPLITTDPWLGETDPAYFGSWVLSHEIPKTQIQEILACPYIWISHGHPDHLNSKSLEKLQGKEILLPDHFGSRISKGLLSKNYKVTILPDRKWHRLSANVKVMCITTILQDSILLVDVNKNLFVNLNDAGTKHCTRFIRKIVKQYKNSYLLSLSGYGDADMINFYNEAGDFIVPPAMNNSRVGEQLGIQANSLGISKVVPFSSHHQYQREDSIWAQEYTTPISSYKDGIPKNIEFIPPFVKIDCGDGQYEEINPRPINVDIKPSEYFGDNWSEELSIRDKKSLEDYFVKKELLSKRLSFINFRVGKKDFTIKLSDSSKKGITFEVPRNSLMQTINFEIFDDLLIGNFMKTTLHGLNSLYDKDISLIIAKYADNGEAQSIDELEKYTKEYKRRAGREFLYENFLDNSKRIFNRLISSNRGSSVYRASKKIYYKIK